MVGSLCREPIASKSPLARQVFLLLENQNNSDLEFVLPTDAAASQISHLVKAHHVILAARCRWFHRALLSGMREAIDRYTTTKYAFDIAVVFKLLFSDKENHISRLFCPAAISVSSFPLW